ncbi:protein CURVATURE THYLAKOID 1C, chloroplastic isoform X1 [Dioscorea cayenensis subsp. rotundata]|uniref:Protein CURVATURE THYLAKOID 1C, chloroplastic isoform X1 n=1 Tax=Dioscorea cayennensis subsp. rotundata TaxID=55577 RepID=A0AB40B5Z1_DIOCR|nr:protein CURVATURE THYLAKOID 1C, chloroplastic isoform X1 [Dioscorea cayenensis subsp. rotundata]
MASASAIALPYLFFNGNRTYLRKNPYVPISTITRGRKRCFTVVAKAVGDDSDSSSGSFVKYVRNAWNNSEDRLALVGLGFAAIAAFWASSSLIAAIDKLPFIPSALEFIGIWFSWWFIYRYILFKPDREELVRNVKNSISDILGQ